jgi:L-seryl-tRNA(Ser) seleniumtransferase
VVLASDLGSGSLIDLSTYGLPREPLPQDKLEAGCDVVSFSGDKLLGGPQAGMIVGSRELVERIRRHPLKRALRVSKLPLLALEATLQLYLRPEFLVRDLPVLRLLTRPRSTILRQARRLRAAVAEALAPRFTVEVVPLMSQIGSGSLPVDRLASAGLRIVSTAARHGDRELEALSRTLRELPRPVLGRIADHAMLWDLRCIEHDRELRAQLPRLKAALT